MYRALCDAQFVMQRGLRFGIHQPVFTSVCFTPFFLTPPCQLHHLLICLFHFWFNAFWLAAFYYPVFRMGISFLIYTFVIYPHVFEMQLWHETRAGCKSDKLCVGQTIYSIYLNAILGIPLN